jgi:hypothetical protein
MTVSCLRSPLFRDSLASLTVYLENCDGVSWNELAREIERIYREVPPSDFLSVAAATCSSFANSNFWCAFSGSVDAFKASWLSEHRAALVTAASIEIAAGWRAEFDLGNFFS